MCYTVRHNCSLRPFLHGPVCSIRDARRFFRLNQFPPSVTELTSSVCPSVRPCAPLRMSCLCSVSPGPLRSFGATSRICCAVSSSLGRAFCLCYTLPDLLKAGISYCVLHLTMLRRFFSGKWDERMCACCERDRISDEVTSILYTNIRYATSNLAAVSLQVVDRDLHLPYNDASDVPPAGTRGRH